VKLCCGRTLVLLFKNKGEVVEGFDDVFGAGVGEFKNSKEEEDVVEEEETEEEGEDDEKFNPKPPSKILDSDDG